MTTEQELLDFMAKIPPKEKITKKQWKALMKEAEKLDDNAGRIAEEHLIMIKGFADTNGQVTNACPVKSKKKK